MRANPRAIQVTYKAYPHLDRVLPAVGYGHEQIRELEETLRRVDAEAVVIGTPVDLRHIPTLPDLVRTWAQTWPVRGRNPSSA